MHFNVAAEAYDAFLGRWSRLLSGKLVDSTVSTTGVVIGTYEPAGEMVAGTFALDS